MKLRFTERPPGRDYNVGDEVDFVGPVSEGYARKYIARGWAVDTANDPKPEPKPEPKPAPTTAPKLSLPVGKTDKT